MKKKRYVLVSLLFCARFSDHAWNPVTSVTAFSEA